MKELHVTTLKNSTSENTDGVDKIIFEDHSDSIAQIQIIMMGQNDTKGDLIFSTNNGSSNSNSDLTEAMRISGDITGT